MKNSRLFMIAIVGLLVVTIVTLQWPLFKPLNRLEWARYLSSLLLLKTIISSVNSILLFIVLAIYMGIYRETGSDFSMGLVIFTIALFLYSITSNPLIHRLAGFKLTGLGPFTMLPDLFTCIASAILLYLSRQ